MHACLYRLYRVVQCYNSFFSLLNATFSLMLFILQGIGWQICIEAIWVLTYPEMWVLYCVVHLAQRSVALVVEGTIWELELAEELPDLSVGPVEDGKDAMKVGPAGTALADGFEVPRPRIAPSIAHNDALDIF